MYVERAEITADQLMQAYATGLSVNRYIELRNIFVCHSLSLHEMASQTPASVLKRLIKQVGSPSDRVQRRIIEFNMRLEDYFNLCIEAGPKNTQYFFKSADVTRFQSYVLALEHGCTAANSLTLSAHPNFGLKLKELLDLGVDPAELLDFKRAAILKVQADRSDGNPTVLCADYAIIRILSQGSVSHDHATTVALQGIDLNEYVHIS